MLLVFGAPCQHSLLAGREHGRTIPLTDIGRSTMLRMPGTISRSPLGTLPLKSPEPMLSTKKCSNFQEDHGKEQTSFQKQKLALQDVNSFASSTALKQGFNGDGAVVFYLENKGERP